MLDLDAVLPDLCVALEDHSYEHHWWFNPASGECEYLFDDEEDPEERGLLYIHPTDSGEGYRDMEEFIWRVADPRARGMLERAISGRGAFRRLKDSLLEFPELRESWFNFHDARVQRRAIEWLLEQELITASEAERALAERPEPSLPEPPLDPVAVARAVAVDLRELYGERLKDVILFGSQARGDADPESDIDLMVVLDRVESRWEEIRRMSDILGRHSLENDTVVMGLGAAESDWRSSEEPVIVNARRDGFSVT